MSNMIKVIVVVMASLCGVIYAHDLKPEVEYAMRHGAKAKICIKVHDDAGHPVSNAYVHALFDKMPTPQSFFGMTDACGKCVADGETNGNKIEFFVCKDGYYGSTTKFSYIEMKNERDVQNGKWQPNNDELRIVLKRHRNPIPMQNSTTKKFSFTTAINRWIGYDLNKQDFIKPYGKGETADFEIFFNWDGEWLPKYSGMEIKIRFTEPYSGFCRRDNDDFSEFKGPYMAIPDLGYMQNDTYFEHIVSKTKRNRKYFEKGTCWVVRSRCATGEDGKLISAHYSVIYDILFCCEKGGVAGFGFTGAFNPTPNDTNLEDIETAERSRHFLRQCKPPDNDGE